MLESLAGFWTWFVAGFCEVGFLCFEGSPNWLGWILLVFFFYFLCLLICGILSLIGMMLDP